MWAPEQVARRCSFFVTITMICIRRTDETIKKTQQITQLFPKTLKMSLAPIPSRLYPRCVGTPLPMTTQAHREPTFLLVQILEKQHLASNAVKGNNQVVYHGLGPRYHRGQLDGPRGSQQAGRVGNPLDNP